MDIVSAGGILISLILTITGLTFKFHKRNGDAIHDIDNIDFSKFKDNLKLKIEDLPKIKDNPVFNEKDREVADYIANNNDYINEWFDSLAKNFTSTLITIPLGIAKILKLLGKAIANKAMDATFTTTKEVDKNIDSVLDMCEAVGYDTENYTRTADPATYQSWYFLATIQYLLKQGVPMIRYSEVPNLALNIVGDELSDVQCRSRHDLFIIPCLGQDSSGFQITSIIKCFKDNPYPQESDGWTGYEGFRLPTTKNGYNEGVTSKDLLDCMINIEKYQSYSADTVHFRLYFDVSKLEKLGIKNLFIFGYTDTNERLFGLPSIQLTNIGEVGLNQIKTTFYGDNDPTSSYWYRTLREDSIGKYIMLPTTLSWLMDKLSNSYNKTLPTTNLTDPEINNPNWILSLIALSYVGGKVIQDMLIDTVPDSKIADNVKNGDLEVVTPDSVESNGEVVGDKTIAIPDDIREKVEGVLTGTGSISDILEKVNASYVSTTTGTVVGSTTETITDAIDKSNASAGGSGIGATPPVTNNVVNTDFVSIWLPTNSEMRQLAGKLWSSDLIENLKKVVADPMDAIISYQQIPFTAPTDGTRVLHLGNYNTGIAMKHCGVQFITKSLGSVQYNLEYDNFLDYDNTLTQLYLPFIGFVELNTREVIGKTIGVKYSMELLTGSCLASVSADNKTIATYTGQTSLQIPITGQNYARAYGNILSGTLGGALTGGVAGAVSGAGMSAVNSLTSLSDSLQKSGSFSVNSGFLGSFTPCLVVGRPIPYNSEDFYNTIGYESNIRGRIGSFSGFCQFENVRLNMDNITSSEAEQIKSMLMEGVVL